MSILFLFGHNLWTDSETAPLPSVLLLLVENGTNKKCAQCFKYLVLCCCNLILVSLSCWIIYFFRRLSLLLVT